MFSTHLVVDLLCGAVERNVFRERVTSLYKFFALTPTVKRARHIDLIGGMVPNDERSQSRNLRA